jgi:hypothetical protein
MIVDKNENKHIIGDVLKGMHIMSASQLDSRFPACLKSQYLEAVASWFLEECYATDDDLTRTTDTPYTKGTTRFGRQKQRLSLEYLSGNYAWLQVENNSLDIVFSIAGIPCRFSNDDADSPKKRAVTEVHPFQRPLIEDAEPGQAARFVFVIDKGVNELSEPKVTLLGFSSAGYEVCRWTSGPVRALRSVNAAEPAPVVLSKPVISLKRATDDGLAAAGQ